MTVSFFAFFYNIIESREKMLQKIGRFLFLLHHFLGQHIPALLQNIFEKIQLLLYIFAQVGERKGGTMKYFVRHFLYDAGSVARVTSQGFTSSL